MPRTGGRQRRENITKQAALLFRTKGYNQTGIRDILKAANISRGAFYFHFKSKKALGAVVVEYYRLELPRIFDEAFATGGWARGVRRFIELFLGTPEEPRMFAMPLTYLGLEFADTDTQLLDAVACVLSVTEERLAEELARHGYPARACRRRAATITACLEGHALRLTIYKDPRCITQAAKDIIALGRTPKKVARHRNASTTLPAAARDRVDIFVKNHLDLIDSRSTISNGNGRVAGATAKRREILAEAAVLFWSRGFQAATVEEILSRCGVPKGSFQYYFKSKRALATRVFEGYKRQFEAAFSTVFAAGSWCEAVEAFCYLLERLGISAEAKRLPLATMALELSCCNRVLARKVSSILKDSEKSFAQALQRYYPRRKTGGQRAALAVALWHGHLARLVIHRDGAILQQLAEDMVEAGG
ncbi:MAG: TetR/AcrR family transcriptional regulator [Planctomycetes bacterium]|nr:TetR/AcrR family transcriptional regulator [Planctomycetota bacterium]